jgi:hypothetical protein
MSMKKVVLTVALFVLIPVEIHLCTPFLPARWESAILATAARIFPRKPDIWDVTHAALDYEIDEAFRKDPSLRVGFYTDIVLLGGNTALLVWVGRLPRRAAKAGNKLF